MLISFGQSSCPASFERWRWADLFSTTFLTGPDSEGVKVGSRDFSTLETIDRAIHSEQKHVINESFDGSPFDGDCAYDPFASCTNVGSARNSVPFCARFPASPSRSLFWRS